MKTWSSSIGWIAAIILCGSVGISGIPRSRTAGSNRREHFRALRAFMIAVFAVVESHLVYSQDVIDARSLGDQGVVVETPYVIQKN